MKRRDAAVVLSLALLAMSALMLSVVALVRGGALMNASAVIVNIAIVFVAGVAGGLIVGVAAQIIRIVRKLSKRDKTS